MYIPVAFMLAGNRWTVHYVSKKKLKGDYGQCDELTNEIWIYSRLGKAKRLQTFIHEAAHAVMYTMGYFDHNEVMVEAVTQLVHQLLITGEHDYEDREEMGT